MKFIVKLFPTLINLKMSACLQYRFRVRYTQINPLKQKTLKWDGSSRWSSSLYCLMWKSTQMTIGKTRPSLFHIQHIDFGDVYFNQTYTHNIQLCNTGVVPAMYQIKDSREELQAPTSTNQKTRLSSKKLLEEIGIFITPTKGVIPCKGDQTLSTVQFQLTIDTKVVSKYNMG